MGATFSKKGKAKKEQIMEKLFTISVKSTFIWVIACMKGL